MTIHLPALSGIVLTYLLVFSRVGAMVMLLPAIGEMGVPSRVRLVLALAIAFALRRRLGARAQRRRSSRSAKPESTV
jgi:flagellar biosynthetic protein FliR